MEPKRITVIMNLSMYDKIRKYQTAKPIRHANVLLNKTGHYILLKFKVIYSNSTLKRLLYYAVDWNTLSIICCKTNFHNLGTGKNDFSYICYYILETYCANTPLIYSRPITYIHVVVTYICLINIYSSVMRIWFSIQH